MDLFMNVLIYFLYGFIYECADLVNNLNMNILK